MKQPDVYVDLDGNHFYLTGLDAEERRLVARLRRRARTNPDWDAFDNYWTKAVPAFYDARGVSRKQSRKTVAFRIAQDLSSRLGMAAGFIGLPDCRGELEGLLLEHFRSRGVFCKEAGIAEDLLDAFLAGRKDLSVDTLEKALERVDYGLRIAPLPQVKEARHKKTG